MDYSKLADVYENLEKTSSKLGKRDILAELLKETSAGELEKIVLLATGQVFPSYSEEQLGIAEKMMRRAIEKVTGRSEKSITEEFKNTGDLGIVAENFVKSKTQLTLMKKKLTVEKIFESLKKLPEFALPPVVLFNAPQELLFGKVGPEGFEEYKLGVRYLPQ